MFYGRLLTQFVTFAGPDQQLGMPPMEPQEEQRIRLDFICVTCLRGNDYLPELMKLDRRESDGAPR